MLFTRKLNPLNVESAKHPLVLPVTLKDTNFVFMIRLKPLNASDVVKGLSPKQRQRDMKTGCTALCNEKNIL